MSTSSIQHSVTKFRAQLMAHEAQSERILDAAYRQVLANIQPMLNKLYDDMVKAMGDGNKVPLTWLTEAQRLENLKKLISGQMGHFAALSQAQALQMQHMGVSLGLQGSHEMMQGTVPPGVHWAFGVPDPKAIATLVGMTQAGSPLSDLFRGFGEEAAQNAAQKLINGLTLGNNPRKVAADIQSALGVSRARALTISRDSLNNTYRSAAQANYQANSDVVESMVRIADLSSRSCAACIALNGTIYDLDADPGFHPNDRCSLAPKTKSWAEILAGTGIDTSNIPDTSINIPSGSSWFAQQDAATQQSILGSKAAYDLYAGGTPLSAFVQHSYDDKWGASIRVKSAATVKAGK